MKKFSWKISLVSATLLALSACSSIDLNNATDKNGGQANENVEPSIQVETFEDLPGCGKKRDGVAAEVGGVIYVCSDGHWDKQEEDSTNSDGAPQKKDLNKVESEDDLLACASKNDGAYTLVGDYLYRCIDRKWENLGIYTASEDDMPNCSKSRDGDVRYLVDEGVSYICDDERWERVGGNSTVETYPSSSSYAGESYNPTPVVDYPVIDPNIMYPIYSSSSAMLMPTFPVYSSSSFMITPAIPVYSSSSVMVVPVLTPVVSSSSVAVTPTPKSSSSKAKSSSSVTAPVITTPACGDMWCGPAGDLQVLTGLDKSPTENAGYWWTYDDNDNGGESKFIWPTALGDAFDANSLTPVIEECGGVCGKYSIDQGTFKYEGYVALAFNVGGANSYGDPYVVNASGWGGVCVVYTSDMAIKLEIGLGDYEKLTEYDNPVATLPVAKNATVKNVSWSSFKQGGWGMGETISGTQASKQITSLKFKFQGKDGTGNFNIMSVGTYGSCK